MIQIKKTILTLVALLAVTTGAWADETPLLTIESKDYTSFTSGSKTFDNMVTITFSDEVNYDGSLGWYTFGSCLLTVAGTNGYTITSCKFYAEEGLAMTGYTIKGESPTVYLSTGAIYTDVNQSVNIGETGVTKIEVYGTAPSAASSGPEVAWDKDKKTGTFTMPGGNVTLEPEYYPQATVADGGVTAADADARATTDDPLVKVDATKLTGAKKLMYFVSNSGTTAPAYDDEGWTDVLPTAEKYTEAGPVNVWYYPVGADDDDPAKTYSDGDMNATALQVTLGAAPLWNAEFDLTDAPEADKAGKWTTNIPEGGVMKGTEVKVTYTGTKKIIGVKAEKKAAPASTPLDNTTTAWTAGTFAVPAGGLTYSDAITVSGDVTLVLTDGETLTLNKGISLASSATLTIEGNGTMNVNGTNNSTASTVAGSGTLVLTSGTLTAKGGNGGGYGDEEAVNGSKQAGGVAINGTVTVSGGTLTATGGAGGSIGDYNARVTAGAGGAAISGSVTLSSGTLTATGGNGGNGGDHSDGTAGAGGAAIGGDLTVNGGTMTTTNGSNGSEIGMTAVNLGAGGKAVAGTLTDNR